MLKFVQVSGWWGEGADGAEEADGAEASAHGHHAHTCLQHNKHGKTTEITSPIKYAHQKRVALRQELQ